MSEYPKPLILPEKIQSFRAKRHKQILQAVMWGISFRLFVILFELIGVMFIDSSAVFLDAISSLMDVLTSVFLIFCMKLAQRPPDHNHPFGHGRYEPIAGLLLGFLLIVLGCVMFFQLIRAFFSEEVHRHIHPWAWLFPAIAMVILELAYRMIVSVAKHSKSPALAADAYHYRIDSLSSLFATVALIAAAFLPEWSVFTDRIGAISIALFMVGLGFAGAKDNFHQLADKIPEPPIFDLVKAAAFKASGVAGTEKIRIQHYGPDAHVDIDIEVDPKLTVEKAHKISQKVRLEIQKAWPAVRDVTVHIEPFYENDH